MAALKSGIKYAVLGGVLGGFMVVFFICVAFLMSDKLYSAKELKNRYRIKILGTMPIRRKKPIGKIDAWLNRMEGRAVEGNADTGYGLITANIRNYAENMKTILMTGTADEAVLSEVSRQTGGRTCRDPCDGRRKYAPGCGNLKEAAGV